MAHWVIEDQGFGGCWYRCSDCGDSFNDIYHDVSSIGPCPSCGASINTDENEYIEETKRSKKKVEDKPYYILLTEEELIDLGKGYIIDITLPSGETARIMNRECYEDVNGRKED